MNDDTQKPADEGFVLGTEDGKPLVTESGEEIATEKPGTEKSDRLKPHPKSEHTGVKGG